MEARNRTGDVRAEVELQQTPLVVPPDATSSVPSLIEVAIAVPPLLIEASQGEEMPPPAAPHVKKPRLRCRGLQSAVTPLRLWPP